MDAFYRSSWVPPTQFNGRNLEFPLIIQLPCLPPSSSRLPFFKTHTHTHTQHYFDNILQIGFAGQVMTAALAKRIAWTARQ